MGLWRCKHGNSPRCKKCKREGPPPAEYWREAKQGYFSSEVIPSYRPFQDMPITNGTINGEIGGHKLPAGTIVDYENNTIIIKGQVWNLEAFAAHNCMCMLSNGVCMICGEIGSPSPDSLTALQQAAAKTLQQVAAKNWDTISGLTLQPASASLVSSPSSQEDDTLIQYVKHSRVGKYAAPCAGCGTSDLYWAHEIPEGVIVTGEEPDYCDKCKTFGQQVLVDSIPTPTGKYRPHSCGGAAPVTDGEGDTESGDSSEDEDERPDLQGPESHPSADDPWLAPDMDTAAISDEAYRPNPGGAPEPPLMPEPPWKSEDADPSQQPADDDEEESQDADDDPHVLKAVWFDARCSDGDWLKKYAELAMTRADAGLVASQSAIAKVATAHVYTEKALAEMQTRLDEVGLGTGGSGQAIVLQRPDKPDKPLPELHHRELPTLIKLAHARLHTLMVGGASVGKGKLAEQVAEALELRYLELPASLNPQTTVSQIIGYMQADGEYVPTLFRDAVEHGGLMFLDEMDNAHPAALASINGILAKSAGRQVAFPDGMVTVHEDFVVLAASNTYGRGPDQTYAARQRGDAATWDRFNVVTLEIDPALEMTLAVRTGAPARTVAEVVRFVRSLRKESEKHHLPVVLGMRTIVDMCKMIHAGVDTAFAVDSRCRRGLSDQDWRKLTGDVRDLELEDA